eukprot:SAG11_NODE_553_length_8575_cov_18.074328_10_plen_143_part_00
MNNVPGGSQDSGGGGDSQDSGLSADGGILYRGYAAEAAPALPRPRPPLRRTRSISALERAQAAVDVQPPAQRRRPRLSSDVTLRNHVSDRYSAGAFLYRGIYFVRGGRGNFLNCARIAPFPSTRPPLDLSSVLPSVFVCAFL